MDPRALWSLSQLLFSVEHAAMLLDVKETRLRELINAGRIVTVQLDPGGHSFIRRCDLEAFVAGLSPKVKGEPVALPNRVTNSDKPHRTPAPRNGREPITPVRLRANQERNE